MFNYFKDIFDKNVSQEFRFKNINETRNYFVKEIDKNQLMKKKHKKICTTLDYIDHFVILASVVTGCLSTSAFVFLLGIAIEITSSAISRTKNLCNNCKNLKV